MDQHLACPHCNQTVAVSTSLAGQAAQCPYCGGEFSVPSLPSEPQTAPLRQAPIRNSSARGEFGSPGPAPRQQAPRQSGLRQPPRREASRTAEASEGGSRLLIGVIVALIAACLPIFVFLGYKLLSRSSAVAAASTTGSTQSDPNAGGAASADSSAAAAPVKAGLPPKQEHSPSVQPTNLPSSTTAPSNSFTPPTAASPAPSVSPSQPPPSAFQAPPTTTPPAAAAPANPAPPPSGSSTSGPSFGSGAPAGGNPGSVNPGSVNPGSVNPGSGAGPRPGVMASTREVVQAIEPSVVVVEVPGVGLGSGFVIDSRGTIATNYHVIEGAKNATVTFLTDKAKFDVTGFLVISPGKDLALLKIEPRDRVLKALPMAETAPDKGEAVLAFGAPKGFGGSVSDGIVSSVRNGSELSEMLGQGGRANIYKDYLGYDLDAVWIQTTAPISGGNSGGPLVNMRGEVVGLNTWNRTDGQNLNFAISVEHVRKILQSVQSGPRALAELPAPRKQHGGGGDGTGAPGDPQKTLAYWEQVGKVNRSMYKRVKKIARPALPVGGRNPKGFAVKMAAYYRKLAEILPDYAARLKDIDVKDVDVELVALVTADAMIMEGVAEELRSLALSAEVRGSVRVFDTEQIAKKSYSSGGRSIGQAFDVMRINFNLKYGLNFPSIAGDASPSKAAIDDDDEDEDKSKSKAKADDKSDDPEKVSARNLTLAKQMLKNPITRDKGIEKLEKIIAEFPNTAAAEEAKKLLKQFAPEKKSHRGG